MQTLRPRLAFKPWIFVLGAVVSAGCLGPIGDQPDQIVASDDAPPDAQGSPTVQNQHDLLDGTPELPSVLHLSNCTVQRGAQRMPGFLAPDPPTQWEGAGSALPSFEYEFWECKRIGLGWMERGPISFALELHNNFVAPANCTTDSPASLVAKWWVDDAGVASTLRSLASWPVALAEFHWDATDRGVFAERAVTVLRSDSAGLSFTSAWYTSGTGQDPGDMHLMWIDDTGVIALRGEGQGIRDSLDPPIGHAEFDERDVGGAYGLPVVPMAASTYRNFSVDASVIRYEDHACRIES